MSLTEMNLLEQIDSDLRAAMLAKDQTALRGLRAIKAALLIAKTEKGNGGEPGADLEVKILQKQIKQRKESAGIYREQGRPDLAQLEEEEIEVIGRYLPAQMPHEQLEVEVAALIKEHGITGQKELGKLMGLASAHFAGRAESKVLSEIARKLLS